MEHTIALGCMYSQLNDQIAYGQYKGRRIKEVMTLDMSYIDELINTGIYCPSDIARNWMKQVMIDQERDLMLLDDESYYSTEQYE